MNDGQLGLLNGIIDCFAQPLTSNRHPTSDVVDARFLAAFGDVLKLHHMLSSDYLDKQRFEAAVERVYNAIGRMATRPDNRCNPGHDLTVGREKWSLKTQGDKGIRKGMLFISKFMELGKGAWSSERDLARLRDQFLNHMKSYHRIFQLRYFRRLSTLTDPALHYYELVEIPKTLLAKARRGEITMMHNSKQSPKPGYCTVTREDGRVEFKLYFDGGTERKLQIKSLRRELCIVHASWEF